MSRASVGSTPKNLLIIQGSVPGGEKPRHVRRPMRFARTVPTARRGREALPEKRRSTHGQRRRAPSGLTACWRTVGRDRVDEDSLDVRGGSAEAWRRRGRSARAARSARRWARRLGVSAPKPRSYRVRVPKQIPPAWRSLRLNTRSMNAISRLIEPLARPAEDRRSRPCAASGRESENVLGSEGATNDATVGRKSGRTCACSLGRASA